MFNFFIFQACKSEVNVLYTLTAEIPLSVLIYLHYVSESVSVAFREREGPGYQSH